MRRPFVIHEKEVVETQADHYTLRDAAKESSSRPVLGHLAAPAHILLSAAGFLCLDLSSPSEPRLDVHSSFILYVRPIGGCGRHPEVTQACSLHPKYLAIHFSYRYKVFHRNVGSTLVTSYDMQRGLKECFPTLHTQSSNR